MRWETRTYFAVGWVSLARNPSAQVLLEEQVMKTVNEAEFI
jgi:hypothetical protein